MKKGWIYLMFFPLMILLLLGVIMMQPVDPLQKNSQSKFRFDQSLDTKALDLDSVVQNIGNRKELAAGYELACAVALSAYPELRDRKVSFEWVEEGAPMEANFELSTLLGGKENRHYRILLNHAESSYFEPIFLRSLPLDAQVGILAHELGHVAYYDQLSLLQIAKWGLCYWWDDEFRAQHERSTDLSVIHHGLGHQLYAYAHFVRHDDSCKDFYYKEAWFMDRYYMTDVEIQKELVRHQLSTNP